MSFSFKSHGLTDAVVKGHNKCDKDGNPAGGFATQHVKARDRDEAFRIDWQDGPINRDAGEEPNGALVEDILDVCLHRLRFYQESKFQCYENACAVSHAVSHIEKALEHLDDRRKDRAERGVLGKHEL